MAQVCSNLGRSGVEHGLGRVRSVLLVKTRCVTFVRVNPRLSTTFAYDGRNRLLSTTDPLGKIETYTYDGNDNLLAWRDANGSQVAQLFDGANRLRGRS